MAISLARAQRHIETWSGKLPRIRAFWPKFVYHSADVSVVPTILRSEKLIPRASQTDLICDVADEGAIARNPDAHQYCRFYFRPKTLFHLRTEGIRCLDVPNRPAAQMSLPAILGFDAERILTAPSSVYTAGKFADPNVAKGDDEAFFDSLDFDAIYHDSGTRDPEVRHKRMAEVICAGNVLLEGNLKFIVCRTPYDRITLMSLLTASEKQAFERMVIIEKTQGSFFVHTYSLYLIDIRYYSGKIVLRLKHSADSACNTYSCQILQIANDVIVREVNVTLNKTSNPQEFGGFFDIPGCHWEIYIEGEWAFRGEIPTASSSVV